MTDTPEQIRDRGLQSIKDCMAGATAVPSSLKRLFAGSLERLHIPFCQELAHYNDPDNQRVADLMRRGITVLIMVNAFNEFIRTTYPEDQWLAESLALQTLLLEALGEGPLS